MNFYLILPAVLCIAISAKQRRIPILNSYDPGPCNNTSHGYQVLVKDRDEDEIILICAKDKNGYKWKSTDGSKNTVGEYFNPGDDCTDILDKLQNAKDGFYWVVLKDSKLQKVWCDMDTDGGGFMLIGRKNGSKTWNVPSNHNPVGPYGEPHWSSSLGDVPILDFRVQMATKEDFKDTKAHWSLRLQSRRPLKHLMMTTAGCDQRSAGIGNIAYVKDLMTEKIVTTNLRCSKFGFAHHPFLKFGWTMMNKCLQKPCPWGFAYHHLMKVQTDNYGAFSFSTSGKISGMEYSATAFVGCENGHCCGCYGPVGGKKKYCAQNCKAINGGTVTKEVFTWFWVRSSLPKRLWKKCMDYEAKREDGKLISYKLVGNSVVPVEGRCNEASALLHDGIVVVPDSSTAQKVPAVDGLLEYRKDKQELYVRSKDRWNELSQTKKVNKEINRLEQVILKIGRTLISDRKECSGYKWLRESSRNEKYSTTSYRCDNGQSTGWYRFGGGAGIKMSTSCTPEHKCQSDRTGWMNGAHPTVADGKVTRKVCFSHGGNCCEWSNYIEVINCGVYYIYKLGPPPRCNAVYCGSDN